MINPQIIKQEGLALNIDGNLPESKLPLFTDSRDTKDNGIFVGLVGESFDGFNFAAAVASGGARVIVYQQKKGRRDAALDILNKNPKCCLVEVEDTLKFLQQFAHAHLRQWKERYQGKVLAITGSNGKTTNKNMLRHFLQAVAGDQVHATDGNFNNHIGVPLTICGLDDHHRYMVIELGTNHPGEIPLLCEIAMPDGGLITNIGNAHIEFFQTEENIFKEKSAIYRYIREHNGEMPLVVSGDDQYLKRLESFPGLQTWGEEQGAIKAKIQSEQQHVIVEMPDGEAFLQNSHIMGDHNFRNLVATFVMADTIFPGQRDLLVNAASEFAPSRNRSSWIEQNGKHYFLDAYNANPASMEAALMSFVTYCSQKSISMSDVVIVLGDMNELGDNAPRFHLSIGALLDELKVQTAIFVGRYASHYTEGFGGKGQSFSSTQELVASWQQVESTANYFFIKGSRSLQLESLIAIN